jgi:RNA polymerase sigma-70 factor, ECF subfamily
MSIQNQQQLLESARKGDREAFRELVNQNSRPLYSLAWRILGDQQLAEDAVQEAFIKAFNQLDKFNQQSKFSTWLYRIATNCAIDAKRKIQRQQTFYSSEQVEQQFASEADTPEYAQQRILYQKLTAAALERLTEQERTAFSLKHYDGLSIKDICEVLELTENSVKQAIFRAVKKLREQLQPMLNEQQGY